MKYINNIIISIKNYFEIRDNDIHILVLEIEIGKLISLRYFDSQ